MTGKNPFASEPDPGPTFPALGPASVQEHFPGAAVGTVRRLSSGATGSPCSQAYLSSSPLKLFPMMTILERASTDQLLHRRLLYSAVPQCSM